MPRRRLGSASLRPAWPPCCYRAGDPHGAAHAVLHPLGAYLIVLAGSAPGQPGGESGSAFGQGQISTPRPRANRRCNRRSLTASALAPAPTRAVPVPRTPAPRSPIRRRAIRRAIYTSRSMCDSFPTTGGPHALVTFVAPYAVSSAISGYTIEQPTPCHEGTIVTQVDRDVQRASRQADAGICSRTPAVRPRPSGCSTEPAPRRRR